MTESTATEQTALILDVEERLRQAMLHSDVRALDELVSPELIFTSHLGQLVTKADDLALHQSGVFRLKELTPSERHIQLHPQFAIISVLMHLVGSYEGTPVDQRIRYTRVWSIASDGSMQIIAGHASAVQS